MDAERAHFCARPRPARFWFPYAGMPDLVVGPAKSDLRLKIAYERSSLRGRVPHDGGRVCACPSAVTPKAAVSRAAESDCQTDRTRRLSAVIRRRDRSGSSRPRSERRASTVPAAPSKTGGDLDCWTSCPLIGQMNGAPGRARTSCLRFRKPPLCPDELRELVSPGDAGARPCALRHGCIRALRAAVIPTDRSALGQVRSPLRRRQSRSRFRPILKIRGSVSLRARLAGATGLRSARLSVLRNVIGESWTGVSPVR